MGFFDKLKKAFEDGTGRVGEAPSAAFPTQIGLIRTAMERYEALPQDGGYWVTFEVGGASRSVGHVEFADGHINLCNRGDIDVKGLLLAAGHADMAERVVVSGDGLVCIERADNDELTLAIDLVIVGGLGAPANYRLWATIQA